MAASDTLKEKLAKNLSKELGYTAAPVGGIFDELLQVVIDLVLDLLSGCMDDDDTSQEELVARMQKPGVIQRWAIRRAIKLSDVARGNRKPVEAAVTATLAEATPEECENLVVEVSDNAVDWSMF